MCAPLLATAFVAPAAAQVTVRVSIDSLGTQANDYSFNPSISADGRYVAFQSNASNLVSGDTNGVTDVFVRDLLSGTERASVDSSGAQTNGGYNPSISADGRFVAFESLATNLVSGDTNGVSDVFVRDRLSGTTERVSLDSLGAQGNSDSSYPRISADGRHVLFHSFASNLVSGDSNGVSDIFVRDRLNGTTELVSIDSLGVQGNDNSGAASISPDGRFVVFDSSASNLVSGDTNLSRDIFLRDRQSGTTECVSVDSFGAPGNDHSSFPSISADGRYVAFESFSGNLVSGDANLAQDVFVRDLQSDTTEIVSLDSFGAQGNGNSFFPSISADGRYVAFHSAASNLVSGDTNLTFDVFVHDRQSDTTERAGVSTLGVQGNGYSQYPSLSADGRFVAFHSDASNLVSGDTNPASDIFVHGLCFPATSATYSGDGLNADTIAPVDVVLGSSWSAPLTIGHPHVGGGPLALKLSSSTVNGPNFTSPVGGRLTEVLVTGPPYGTFSGTHDGVAGDIVPQTVPYDLALVGLPWAAQYTVVGGGFGDFSQAVAGVVGCP